MGQEAGQRGGIYRRRESEALIPTQPPSVEEPSDVYQALPAPSCPISPCPKEGEVKEIRRRVNALEHDNRQSSMLVINLEATVKHLSDMVHDFKLFIEKDREERVKWEREQTKEKQQFLLKEAEAREEAYRLQIEASTINHKKLLMENLYRVGLPVAIVAIGWLLMASNPLNIKNLPHQMDSKEQSK